MKLIQQNKIILTGVDSIFLGRQAQTGLASGFTSNDLQKSGVNHINATPPTKFSHPYSLTHFFAYLSIKYFDYNLIMPRKYKLASSLEAIEIHFGSKFPKTLDWEPLIVVFKWVLNGV